MVNLLKLCYPEIAYLFDTSLKSMWLCVILLFHGINLGAEKFGRKSRKRKGRRDIYKSKNISYYSKPPFFFSIWCFGL